jgi:hypothetical protein
MPSPGQKLLIISRDALLEVEPQASSELVFRQLANLNRRGFHLLLTASEPDQWVPTRGNVDSALRQQRLLQNRIQQAGADLDGVYYVPRSLLTQDRNREGALKDILKRYSATPAQALLMSSSAPFLKAAALIGIETHEIITGKNGQNNLLAQLKSL